MMKSAVVLLSILFGPLAMMWMFGMFRDGDTGPSGANGFVVPGFSVEAETGRVIFSRACGSCHGTYGEGSEHGPPLVHPLYASDRLSREGFTHAIRNGVEAYRWPFGNMAPVADVDTAKIANLYRFVREMQRANGID